MTPIKQPPLFITEIKQKDNQTLSVDWSDGVHVDYTLEKIQKNCPCAGCNEKRKEGKDISISSQLKAVRVASVGSYALRIYFTEGCSAGIYSYDHLRKIADGCNE